MGRRKETKKMTTTDQIQIIAPGEYQALYESPPRVRTPEEMLEFQLQCFVERELAMPADADPFRKRLPEHSRFLFVPKRPKTLNLKCLMAMIKLEGKRGVNYLNAQFLVDFIEVPEEPYLMTDIEDGRARLNVAPSVSQETISAESRSPFTTFEGIVFGIVFPVVLTHHNLDLIGSRYESGGFPYLCLSDDKPTLYYHWGYNAYPRWGAPSCGSRLGA